MKRLIYADNAATTQLDKIAFDAMAPWLLEEYGNASQPYAFAREPKKALAKARATIAECINASPDEIFFTSGGTESDNWAIKGTVLADGRNRATITSAFEHQAVLHSCAAIERLGCPVAYLMPTTNGVITPGTLSSVISNTTRLVSIMFANNEIGSIQPIEELCSVAHAHGALFHTDAVQAVGHVKINVQEIEVDMLSASAHKFNGPKGIGFLYIRKGTNIAPYADGGAQESGMRAGTENVASIVGMAVALKRNVDSLSENGRYLRTLEQKLLAELTEAHIDFIRNGINQVPGNISLSFRAQDGERLLHRLDLMGICVSTGSACDGNNSQISHVIRSIGVPSDYANGTIRISLGKHNSEDDVTCITAALKRIL